MTKLIPNK